MQPKFKSIALSSEQIHELRKNSLWNEMVGKYGESNIINNYVVDYVVLQEEKDIFDASGQRITVTPDLIKKVYHANQSIYEKFISAPINQLKSWVKDSPELVGHVPIQQREGRYLDADTPIITDHKPKSMADKHGLVLSGSYRLVKLPNKQGKEVLHLLCKGILLSPESKFGYISDNWRQVSPTITQSYKIDELSYVPYSAQMGNSSLAGAESKITSSAEIESTANLNRSEPLNIGLDLRAINKQVSEANQAAEQERQENQFKIAEAQSDNYVDKLVASGIITSGQKKKLSNVLMQLASGERRLVADAMGKLNQHRISKQGGTKTFFLQGAVELTTATERFDNFNKENQGKYKTAGELMTAFQEEEINHSKTLKLAGGEGQIIDPKAKYAEILDLLEKDEKVDSEIKDRIISLCSSKFGLKLSDGSNVDAGGISQPNNTTSALAGAEDKLAFEQQSKQIQVLTDAVGKLSSGYESLQQENTRLNDVVIKLSAAEPPITQSQENNSNSQGGE